MQRILGPLCILIAVAVMVATSLDALDRFIAFGDSDNPLRNRAVLLVIWGLSLVSMLGMVLIRSRFLRLLLALPLVIATLAEVSYFLVARANLYFGELNSMWLARDNAASALFSYWGTALPAMLIATCLLLALLFLPYWGRGRQWLVVLYLLAYPVPFLLIAVAVQAKGGAAALGTPAAIRPVAMLGNVLYSEWTDDFDEARSTPDPATFGDRRSTPHIVLIMDETVRGDYLSINQKGMQTTPFLESQSGRTANFGIASASFDCSVYSNAAVRYGVSPTRVRESLLSHPSVWAYARQAGYATNYIDAQRRHGQLQNLMSLKERGLIDNFIQYSDVEPVERGEDFMKKDFRAAKDIQRLLELPTPQFVFVNKEGAHTPYEGKYPVEKRRFVPHMELREPIHERLAPEKLKNSYRNAVAWSVDDFFSELAKDRTFANSVIFYTADHGQNLLDRGVPTHCAQSNPHMAVASVPLFVFGDHAEWMPRFKTAAVSNQNRAAHFNIFKTLLMVMGYPVETLRFDYAASLLEPLGGEQFFYTGDLMKGELRKHRFSSEALLPQGP